MGIHKQAFKGKRSQKMRTVSTFLLISLFFRTAMPRALEFRFDPDELHGSGLEQNGNEGRMIQMDREAADNTAKTTTTPSNNEDRNEETTADPCVDAKGEEWCQSKIDKCDKQNIIAHCEKTCGVCQVDTTVASTTTEGSTTTGISSTVETTFASTTIVSSTIETTFASTTFESSTTASVSSTVDKETTTADGKGSTTPSLETTPDPCVDAKGEEFCLSKIDKCDKTNIIAHCEKTCGKCQVDTTVATTTMAADNTTTVDEETTTPSGKTTPDPCVDAKGEEWCQSKIDKCDKQNIITHCEKTCGV